MAAHSDMNNHPHSNKCGTCKGIGKLVRQVPSDRYKCGFITEAYTCPACMGTGREMPASIDAANDHKMAAAGDRS